MYSVHLKHGKRNVHLMIQVHEMYVHVSLWRRWTSFPSSTYCTHKDSTCGTRSFTCTVCTTYCTYIHTVHTTCISICIHCIVHYCLHVLQAIHDNLIKKFYWIRYCVTIIVSAQIKNGMKIVEEETNHWCPWSGVIDTCWYTF